MSGHSKWATTHRAKEATDAKKGQVFTKLANAIIMAAKLGGDPDSNFKLKLAIDKAKGANMPKENIERAIKRGTGELTEGMIEEVVYEGFGPAGVAVIVECFTANRNHAGAQVKHILSEFGGHLGTPNSVSWQFEKKGVARVSHLSDEQEMILIDLGATDIQTAGDWRLIYCQPHDLLKIKKFLDEQKISVESAELEMVAKDQKIITDPGQKESLEKFFQALENEEEVNNYFTNAEFQ